MLCALQKVCAQVSGMSYSRRNGSHLWLMCWRLLPPHRCAPAAGRVCAGAHAHRSAQLHRAHRPLVSVPCLPIWNINMRLLAIVSAAVHLCMRPPSCESGCDLARPEAQGALSRGEPARVGLFW